MFERQSALLAYCSDSGRDGVDGKRRLRFTELRDWQLSLLAAFPATEAAFAGALAAIVAVPVSPSTRKAMTTRNGLLFNTAPRQYWFVSRDASIAAALEQALLPSVGTCTNLSHSRVRIRLEGAEAAAVLAKGISVDLHPLRFAVGEFVQTSLHHTAVLLHRVDAEVFDLYLPRTFAASLWEWLTDAALPQGYEVTRDTGTRGAPIEKENGRS